MLTSSGGSKQGDTTYTRHDPRRHRPDPDLFRGGGSNVCLREELDRPRVYRVTQAEGGPCPTPWTRGLSAMGAGSSGATLARLLLRSFNRSIDEVNAIPSCDWSAGERTGKSPARRRVPTLPALLRPRRVAPLLPARTRAVRSLRVTATPPNSTSHHHATTLLNALLSLAPFHPMYINPCPCLSVCLCLSLSVSPCCLSLFVVSR